jgi:hypothetical protein
MGAVQAALHEKLRESLEGHTWLAKPFLEGSIPSPTTAANYAERVDGLISLIGNMISAMDQLAVEIDGIKGQH